MKNRPVREHCIYYTIRDAIDSFLAGFDQLKRHVGFEL